MVALTGLLIAQAPGDMRWLRVEDPSAAAACRGAALALASRLEFPAARADQVALAVTEAASNLHKHASQGAMLLRIGRDGDKPGIEMVTIDAGPGVQDTSAALRDGHSTSGTLGVGLGTIRRLADFYDLYSAPGHGTVLVARFWPAPRPGRRPATRAWSGRSPVKPSAATPSGWPGRTAASPACCATGSGTARSPRPPRWRR